MYISFVTLLPVLMALIPALAEPNQSVSLAGRRHGLRRSGICGRAGHGGDRGSARKPKISSSSSAPPVVSAQTTIAPSAVSTVNTAAPASPMATTASIPASASSASSETPSGGNTTADGKAALTPNGMKAGMTLCTGLEEFTGKLGWCYGKFHLLDHPQTNLITRLVPQTDSSI